jgi:deoxyribodipyrimidine photolyase-related protein
VEFHEDHAPLKKLVAWLKDNDYTKILVVDPADFYLDKWLHEACEAEELDLKVLDSPMFLNTREELSDFFRADKKKFYQTTFYKSERKARDILITGSDDPEGGKWTYDTENRKKYPKGKTPPNIQFPDTTSAYKEALDYVEDHFEDNYGQTTDSPLYALDFESAKDWFEQFLEQRFAGFGPYEDAIVKEEIYLHHSVLTPMLNVGLLTPQYVLDRSLEYAQENDIKIQSLEGFVRQIMGWREFIRGMYMAKGVPMRTTNYWGFDRKIPRSFYTGETGIPPIDDTIKKVLKTGYCHHIERLMVLGNFMLLCEFDPKEVYKWFMELFIDAYDWVMVPNVYGMSQFADGGFFATKPYISSSNYILKMSNYSKGDWQEIWDALFWHFMDKQREFFSSNPRLAMLLGTFDKWDAEKRSDLISRAQEYFETLT